MDEGANNIIVSQKDILERLKEAGSQRAHNERDHLLENEQRAITSTKGMDTEATGLLA